MKLLTFLGTGKYSSTVYTWQGKEHECCYAPVATVQFLAPEQLIVFLTEDAQEKAFSGLKDALPNTNILPVPIPQGKDEIELWEIFSVINHHVQDGDQVAFDVTHGLRSSPVLALLAAAFMRSGRNVDVRHVLYGAYDVRDQSVTPHRTPMFDLSPMLKLLEWADAADRFTRTGDARYLASLVKEQKKPLAETSPEQAGSLGKLESNLTELSQALRLIRPYQAMDAAAVLPQRLEDALPAIEARAAARPFELLLEQVSHAYSPMGFSAEERAASPAKNLHIERQMIRWYAGREQWVQAASLAREWLVSWVMVHLGDTNLNDITQREQVSETIGGDADAYKKAKRAKTSFQAEGLPGVPKVEEVLSLWLSLTEARNDIDHAGKRPHPLRADQLIKNLGDCFERLYALDLPESA